MLSGATGHRPHTSEWKTNQIMFETLTFIHLLFSGFCTHATAVKFHLSVAFVHARRESVSAMVSVCECGGCEPARSAIRLQL